MGKFVQRRKLDSEKCTGLHIIEASNRHIKVSPEIGMEVFVPVKGDSSIDVDYITGNLMNFNLQTKIAVVRHFALGGIVQRDYKLFEIKRSEIRDFPSGKFPIREFFKYEDLV